LGLILCFLTGFSQVDNSFYLDQFERNVISERAHRMSSGLTYDRISGSPYFSDEFTEGEVIMQDGEKYEGVLLRYDIYSNRIEFKNKDGQIMEILEPERYDRFIVGENIFKYIPYEEGNKTHLAYMQTLTGGKVTLYKKLRVDFQEAKKPQAYQDAVPPKFVVMAPDYYLSVDGNPAWKIKSQKQTIELLSSAEAALPSYVRKEKLNLNKEEELIRAIEFCNK